MDVFRVLVASDGSEVGEHAVDVARSLTERDGASLVVMGVDTEGLPGVARAPSLPRGVAPSARLLARGVPGVEIVRQASLAHADLVVLGRGTRSLGKPTSLGSTTDAVIRRRHGPSLFIPPAISRFRRVLIALDGTKRGLSVLDAATRVLALTGAEPNSVTVIPDGEAIDTPQSDPRVIRVRQALERFPKLGGPARLRVLGGDPVGQILRLLTEMQVDLLVLGVRGGGPAGEMGSGHVGRDLLQTAPVAILSIPI
jgi:nucleotide-binding universal stress UspA family protein